MKVELSACSIFLTDWRDYKNVVEILPMKLPNKLMSNMNTKWPESITGMSEVKPVEAMEETISSLSDTRIIISINWKL